ncbi:FAD-dependent oxidoreductase [Candidatus Kaiserbacteria bacterium]|nr:MAG: FAD-dependent oxidoreductase [Candidatus Kaiserbacteria bacterium]
MFDLTIIGGGPAGTAVAVYAARKRLKSVLITEEWGGQSNVSEDIQNWIGTPHISGGDLAKSFEAHVREYADDVIEIQSPAKVETIEKIEGGFKVVTNKGESYESKAVFVGVGSSRRKLPAKGADKFEHKGLTYCASCDGPLFTGRDVVVIGGGNAGFETAAQLLAYTNSVTLLEFNDTFLADEITVEKLMKNDKFKALKNVEITEVVGEAFVTGVKYKDRATGEETELATGGVFVEIGMIPNTQMVKDLVELDERNMIKVDPYTQRTSVEGIWAAGDCTDGLYHQNNIAAGDAVKAIEDMYGYLR